MTELDRGTLDSLLPATPGTADWDDVLRRSGGGRPGRGRLVVLLAAAALVVALGTASAFAVRDLIVGTSSGGAGSPTWSPDGKRIVFVVSRGGRDDLYVVNADGSAKPRLMRPNAPAGVVWSPDGRKLAFVKQYDVPCGSHICVGFDTYVMNADGSAKQRLMRNAIDPAWLPDGRLAIVKWKDCWRCTPKSALWVMNADGSGRRLVASGSVGRFDWSPDGRSIAFEGYPSLHRPGIYLTAADGSGRRWLADGTRPLWSPRGGVIAFRPDLRPDPSNDLRLINADGSGERTLTTHLYAVNGSQGYAWSPDGRKIVFTFGRFPVDLDNTEIYVVNADGSGQRNLTRHAGADDYAAWSPDGQKIAFSRSGEIYVMNADGSGQRKLGR